MSQELKTDAEGIGMPYKIVSSIKNSCMTCYMQEPSASEIIIAGGILHCSGVVMCA